MILQSLYIGVFKNLTMADKVKIISFNCRGLRKPKKRAKIMCWAKNKKFDIMALQESHYLKGDEEVWNKDWDGLIIGSEWNNDSRGVCFLINKNLDYKIKEQYLDNQGRWIALLITIKNLDYAIGNYYGPNDDKPRDLSLFLDTIDSLECPNTILMGDFNFVFNTKIDKMGGNNTTNSKCRDHLIRWMNDNNNIDIWRTRNPNERKYTWVSNTKPPIFCRLDFFIISNHLAGKTTECNIVPGLCSDHSCITIGILNTKSSRGRGLWKFNNSLLNEKGFKNNIIETINNTAADNKGCNDRLMWDTIKCTIRGKCIQFSSRLAKQKRDILKELSEEVNDIENNLIEAASKDHNEIAIDAIEHQLKNKKGELENLVDTQVQGAAIRSRAQWFAEGDKPSIFFLNLEKSRAIRKTVTKLKLEDGREITTDKDILTEESKFYGELYKSKSANKHTSPIRKEIMNLDSPKLDKSDIPPLEEEITEEEIENIIKNSKKNKSPGSDGLTTEFYLAFWPYIKKYLLAAYKEALNEGELSISQKRGIITLIPKEQKDPLILKNWRPITLLNHDYKYLAKCLGDRIKNIIPSIVSPDQTGFVNGRVIGTNILRTQDLISHCRDNHLNGVMINIDFEKAFDSIEWEFIWEAMEFFHFPKKYICWIKCLYQNIETAIINNGHLSTFFKPSRGVRQGCPLSPSIFVIAIELLSLYMKHSKLLEGIQSPDNNNYLISQFADDTSIAVINKPGCLDTIFKILNEFSEISGLKINIEKSEIMMLGICTLWDIPKQYRGIVKDEVKSLGIWISNNTNSMVKKNYELCRAKITHNISVWKRRKMSLAGKISIIKTMLTSQLVYCMTVLPSPAKDFWKAVEKELYEFIADSKTEKIKRSTLIAPYHLGGFNMIDITSQNMAIKASWIVRLWHNAGTWKDRALYQIPIVDFRYLIQCNLAPKDIPKEMCIDPFWDEVWKAWCHFNFQENIEDPEVIYHQSLWYNSLIRVNNKICIYRRWIDAGIMWISNITKEQGNCMFLKHNELEQKYSMTIPFTEYYGLIKSIPKEWHIKLSMSKTEDIEDYNIENLWEKVEDAKRPSKLIYNACIAGKLEKPSKPIQRWNDTLGENLEADTYIESVENTRKITINNKLRSFNYNFLMRNVSYGGRLYKLLIADTPQCQLCNIEETLLHMYWECPNTQRLWERLKSKLEEEVGIYLPNNNPTSYLFNIYPEQHPINYSPEEDYVIRITCLLTKHFINRQKCLGGMRSIEGLEIYIKQMFKTEEYLAQQKGTVYKISPLWKQLANAL